MSKSYEILILGNNLAGGAAAHYLLKHTLPALKAADGSKSYHVTVVGPSNKYYFKIPAPRILAAPDLISLDQATMPFGQSFEQYATDEFTWVRGLATGVSEADKTVSVTLADASTQTLHYDSLIVATGSRMDPLWAADDDFSATENLFAAMHEALPNAKTVLIAGGGPVGVETAGEITAKYPNMKVTLLSGTDRVLSQLSTGTSGRAEKMLKSKGVQVIHGKKVTAPAQSSASETTVTYDDGTTETCDIYINAIGGRPNTDFLPSSWLNSRGKITVDNDTLRSPVADVYALGDVASCSNSTVMDLQFSWGALVSAVGQDIVDKLDSASKNRSGPFRPRKFKPLRDSQFVPIGRGGGVAQIMGWPMPSFLVWIIKARTFFIEKAKAQLEGTDYAKV